jgi:rhodanese-related sulfurtransferase
VRVARETLFVLVFGVLLGLAVGLVRGFPVGAQAASTDVTGACVAPVPETPEIRWLSQQAARRELDRGAVFVDARDREAFVQGHVASALSVPMDFGTVPDDVVEQLRSAPLIVAYCDTSEGCSRSTRLAGLLASAGVRDVRVLEGGIPEWIEHGYPAEAGACRLCP